MDLRIIKDGGLLIGLIGALCLVYFFDRGKPREENLAMTPITIKEDDPPPPPPPALRLAVTPVQYDDMGRLLKSLGKGFDFKIIEVDEVLDPSTLGGYDVVFLTCGGIPADWAGQRMGDGARNTEVVTLKPGLEDRLRSSIRSFVEKGGTLYASDWRFSLAAIAFPELVDRNNQHRGDKGTVQARVVDPGLRDVLGSAVQLHFDLPGWYAAALKGGDVHELMRGGLRTEGKYSRTIDAPLLVKFGFGKGTVIFTSFHNERQNSETEEKLLKYLVFSALLAKQETVVRNRIIEGGFKPQKNNILGLAKGNPETKLSYECTGKGTLKFVLNFENRGATLSLVVTSPDGQSVQKKGTSTFEIDIAEAVAGKYDYTISAENLPGEDFPFNLQVAFKEK